MRALLRALIGRRAAPTPPAPPATPHLCPACGQEVAAFEAFPESFLRKYDEFGLEPSLFLFETLNLFAYGCPHCGASDRDRLYAWYVRDDPEFFGRGIAALDIAPSPALASFLKALPGVRYRSCDLAMEGVDDRIDLADMSLYENESFDFLVCSHVLEHVPDDRAAARELLRVLRPGGRAILMAPVYLGREETLEDRAFSDEAARWKHYAQNDHVRLYSKNGFLALLTGAGFRVEALGAEHFGAAEMERRGVHPRSVLYIGHKG